MFGPICLGANDHCKKTDSVEDLLLIIILILILTRFKHQCCVSVLYGLPVLNSAPNTLLLSKKRKIVLKSIISMGV